MSTRSRSIRSWIRPAYWLIIGPNKCLFITGLVVFFGAPLIVWLLLKGEEQCGFPLGAAFLPCVLAYRACRKLSWILPQGGQETEESLYSHDRAGIPGTALGRIHIQNHRTTLMSQRDTSKRLSQSIPNTMYSASRSLSPRDKISPKDYITVRAINPGFFYLGMDELFLGFFNLMAIFVYHLNFEDDRND